MSPFGIFAVMLIVIYFLYYGVMIFRDLYGKRGKVKSDEEEFDVSLMEEEELAVGVQESSEGFLIDSSRQVAVAYLFFAKDNLMGACLIAGAWYAFYCIFRFVGGAFGDSKEKPKEVRPDKKRVNHPSSVNWNFVLMCLIPLFWPVLIFRLFFNDKGNKQVGKLDAYDYEQHLKCNRRL